MAILSPAVHAYPGELSTTQHHCGQEITMVLEKEQTFYG